MGPLVNNILMRPIKKNDQIQKEIKNMKILILDDDQSRHVLFKRNLIGHIVLSTYMAEEAITALQAMP